MEGKAKSRAAILDRPSSLNALSAPMVLFWSFTKSSWSLEAYLFVLKCLVFFLGWSVEEAIRVMGREPCYFVCFDEGMHATLF